METGTKPSPGRAPRRFAESLEETLIAVLLGVMTLVTFANVIARYVFNSNILWALETTVFLFAWLVLLGASYGVKKTEHLGVDIITARLPAAWRRAVALFATAACLAFSILLLIGSWSYWFPFATERAFLEVNDIPMPGFLQFLAGWLNEGEPYEKMPKFIPYAVLPISMTLLVWRFLQTGWRILRGEADRIITSHDAEEQMAERDAA